LRAELALLPPVVRVQERDQLAAGLAALRFATRRVGERWGTIQADLLAKAP